MIDYENKFLKLQKSKPKLFYGYVNSKRVIKQSVVSVKDVAGKLATSPEQTADLLGAFFESTFTTEPYGPLNIDCYNIENQENLDDDFWFDASDVKTELMNLDISKSMGPDEVHPKLLQALASNQEFVNSLAELFNTCYKERKMPAIWKSANVTPIHKKGSVTDAKNYRPISLTSILCKIYEKFLRSHILGQVVDKITPKQHGFVAGRSCLSNLLDSIDSINEMLANGDNVDVFYMDFQKAFDTVPHHRLLTKMKNLGINNHMISVISDFLSDRTFNVRVGDSKSKAYKVTSGIPQGSILGPLLFLIYINDLPEGIKNKILLFADDVRMCSNASYPDVSQGDIDKMLNWQNKWLLKFNIVDQKCKVMHIGKTNPKHIYKIDGMDLPSVEEEKDLGVLMTSNYNWDTHINKCIKKANSCTAWITRSIISRDKEVMLKLYTSLVRPHLEYCVQLWNPKACHGNWGLIMDIENVQRRYTRLIDGIGLMTYRERLNNLSITTLVERRARGDLLETFKIVNGIVDYGRDMFILSRSGQNLIHPPNKVTKLQNEFFSQRVLSYWNKLPNNVKNCDNLNAFKTNLENFKRTCKNSQGQFWELSEEIFSRINDCGREAQTEFLRENPDIAKRKRINIY